MRIYYQKMYGRPYEGLYRASMGCSAAFRLLLLGILYPISGVLKKKESVLAAADKWRTILKWALGLERITPEQK